jgi:hypothetical protein
VVAIRIGSPAQFGLSMLQPGSTGSLALMIALFSWGPDEATVPANLHFFTAAAACFGWGSFTIARLRQHPLEPAPVRPWSMPRFTMRTLLAVTTWLCVVLTLCSVLDWNRDYPAFAMYSLGMGTAMTWLAIVYASNVVASGRPSVSPLASE